MKKALLVALLSAIPCISCAGTKESYHTFNKKAEYKQHQENNPNKTYNNFNKELDAKYVQAARDFSLDMYLSFDNEDNTVFSPISIATLLSMVEEGSKANTKVQLDNVLHYDGSFVVKEEMKKMLLNTAIRDQNDTTVEIAQSVWGGTNKEDYLKLLEEYYFAEMIKANVTDPSTAKLLAEWVNDKTYNFLKVTPDDMLGLIDPNTALILLNAVYLESKWDIKFPSEKNHQKPFYGLQEQTVTYMSSESESVQPYVVGDNYVMSSIPFKCGIRMNIILPNKDVDYKAFFKNRNNMKALLDFTNTNNEDLEEKVRFNIPKFTFKNNFSLTDNLMSLGATDMFGNADISGMIGRPGEYCIGNVVHGAGIQIDNNGVKAAAYTGANATTKAGSPAPIRYFNVYNPFAYTITDRNGLPLFMGTMYSI